MFLRTDDDIWLEMNREGLSAETVKAHPMLRRRYLELTAQMCAQLSELESLLRKRRPRFARLDDPACCFANQTLSRCHHQSIDDRTIVLAVSLTHTASAFLDGVVDEYTIKYLLRHDLWHGWKPRAWLHPPLKVPSPALTSD